MQKLRWILSIVTGVVCVVSLVLTTHSAFNASISESNSNSSQRIFAGSRTHTFLDIIDASSGAEINKSNELIAVDGNVLTTSSFAVDFSPSSFVDIQIMPTRAANVPVSSATLNLDMKGLSGASSNCVYVELRATSTDSLMASYGSSQTPLLCSSGVTLANTQISVAISNTDELNDLTIRIYASASKSNGLVLERVALTGETPYGGYSAYPKAVVDQATGTPTLIPWSLAINTDTSYYTSGAWTGAFSGAKYMKLTGDLDLPIGSTINSVVASNAWRTSVAGTACVYYEIYNGGALIQSFGSSGSPYSCSSSTTVFTSDSLSLTSVTTPSIANNLVIKAYYRTSANGPTATTTHSSARITINWKLV